MENETGCKEGPKSSKDIIRHDTQRLPAVNSILDNLTTYKDLLKQLFEEYNELCSSKASGDTFEKFSKIYFKTLIRAVLNETYFEKVLSINMRDEQFVKVSYGEMFTSTNHQLYCEVKISGQENFQCNITLEEDELLKKMADIVQKMVYVLLHCNWKLRSCHMLIFKTCFDLLEDMNDFEIMLFDQVKLFDLEENQLFDPKSGNFGAKSFSS